MGPAINQDLIIEWCLKNLDKLLYAIFISIYLKLSFAICMDFNIEFKDLKVYSYFSFAVFGASYPGFVVAFLAACQVSKMFTISVRNAIPYLQ